MSHRPHSNAGALAAAENAAGRENVAVPAAAVAAVLADTVLAAAVADVVVAVLAAAAADVVVVAVAVSLVGETRG